MSKQTKNTKEKSPKKDHQVKAKFFGLCDLAVGLAELATVYVFATQDNRVLLPIAVVLGIDASIRFGKAFVK